MAKFLLLLAALSCVGCRDATLETEAAVKDRRARATGLLEIEPLRMDWGTVSAGSKREGVFAVINPQRYAVEVVLLKTSCDCASAKLSESTFPSGHRGKLVVNLDLSKEPTFSGDLRIEVTGSTNDGRVAFAVQIDIHVDR